MTLAIRFLRLLTVASALLIVSACGNSTSNASEVRDSVIITNPDPDPGVAFGFPIVDTAQKQCYNNSGGVISCSSSNGQDGQYKFNQPNYTDNGDGTISDNVSGLMWQKTPGVKMSWNSATTSASTFNLAGHTDWRLPSIKELYSLINFNGVTGMDAASSTPFLDTAYFNFSYGNADAGERFIDSQYWSSTEYVSTTMGGDATVFGVNFADGRIKGYPKFDPMRASDKLNYVIYVRNNSDYGKNLFKDNGDGTITDEATQLMWMQDDSGTFNAGSSYDGKLTWDEALVWCDASIYAGHDDWRLPNAKEMQSIVDYARSPVTTNSAAIDPIFNATAVTDEGGYLNWAFYWTSTTHLDGPTPGMRAVYIAFGEALGYMRPPGSGSYVLLDVHGAGAQRSDPKVGDPADYPYGLGPQGDVIRIYNFARCTRQ